MPDSITTTDQTSPLDAGHTTTESRGTKVVVILTSVIGALGTITTVLDQVTNILPASTKWIGPVVAIVGVISAGLTQIAYTVMRTWIKVEAIKAGKTPPVDPAAVKSPDAAAANLGQ
jgi:hypothetical protein